MKDAYIEQRDGASVGTLRGQRRVVSHVQRAAAQFPGADGLRTGPFR